MVLLVAGVGNIFNRDDGFGVAVARELMKATLPEGVVVRDFGIRGRDLAFELLEDWTLVVIVDAVSRGGPPGTIYLVEPDQSPRAEFFDAHSIDPNSVITLARQMKPEIPPVLIVGLEPESVDDGLELGALATAAIPRAVEIVREIIEKRTTSTTNQNRLR